MGTSITFPGVRPSRRPPVPLTLPAPPRQRIQSVDLLRGLVMVIMALDHVRDYFTQSHFDPADLAQTTAPLFFTRWITHFCAPVFILLAGSSAWMAGRRRTPAELSRFLFTRGLWLILLEFTVMNFAWYFNFEFENGFRAQVIWAIGASMVVLAGLIRLPRAAIITIAIALIAGHNRLDQFDAALQGHLWWSVLHASHAFPDLHLFVLYPILPWIGVMAAGYALGPVLEQSRFERNQVLVALGTASIAAFLVLRMVGLYGDPSPWQVSEDPVITLLSFFNTTKYPPSLEYLLMTLGPALIGLAVLDEARGKIAEWFITFGRAPFFYYIVHIFLIHALAVLAGVLTGFRPEQMTHLYRTFPAEYGFSLSTVYLIWIGVVSALYIPTRWFADLKQRSTGWWWGYV